MYEVIVYQKENGQEPFMEWARSLTPEIRNRVFHRIYRIQSGNLGDYKRVSKGLFKLRFFFHGGLRVYFGRDGDKIIILLSGGDISTQQRDIEKAKTYWDQYNADEKNDTSIF